jgi:2-methylisocitrate lyase-like PEP mutase family enzyme
VSFHDLHHQGVPFVLPNAWDVPSAMAYLADGFAAIGTTSFGVASSAGHPDGGRTTRDANSGLAAALVRLPCYVGVARVSTGSAPYRAASYAAAQVARAVRDGRPLPPSTL